MPSPRVAFVMFPLLALCVTACTNPADPGDRGPADTTTTAIKRSTHPTVHARIPAAPNSRERPGPAYLQTWDHTVALIDGEWAEVEVGDDEHLPTLISGADGRVYLQTDARLELLSGTRRETVVSVHDRRQLMTAAIGPLGELAVVLRDPGIEPQGCGAAPGGITQHLLRAGSWSVAASDFQIRGGATWFDRQGRVWTHRGLLDGQSEPWLESAERSLSTPVPAAPHRLATSNTGATYLIRPGSAERIDLPSLPFAVPRDDLAWAVAVSPSGTLALKWQDCEVARVVLGARPGAHPEVERFEADMNCHFDGSVSIDGQDRVWVPTITSLWVFPVDAAPVEYRAGTVPILASGVLDVAVVGAGPALPEPGRVHTVDLSGRIVADDQLRPVG